MEFTFALRQRLFRLFLGFILVRIVRLVALAVRLCGSDLLLCPRNLLSAVDVVPFGHFFCAHVFAASRTLAFDFVIVRQQ